MGTTEEWSWLRVNFRWVFRVENVEVNGDADEGREAAIAKRKTQKGWGLGYNFQNFLFSSIS